MLQIDGTIIVLAISFIIFMFVMQQIFYSPMDKVRQERNKYIEKNKELAQKAEDDSLKLVKQRDEKIHIARKQASNEVLTEKDSAKQLSAKTIKENNIKAQEKLESSKNVIAKDKEVAKEELKKEVINLAHQISSKVLGKEVPMSGISNELVEKALNS